MSNISIITTVEDCNTILAEAGQIKSSLEYKVLSDGRKLLDYQTQATQLPTALTETEIELASYVAQLPSLPEGKRRQASLLQINNLENDIRAFRSKMARYGPMSYGARSRDLAYNAACITAIDEVITAVTARRTEIETAAAA
jgi:hypothetical protein